MSKAITRIFGTLLAAALVAGAVLLPMSSAGAERERRGKRSGGGVSVPGSVTRRGQGFDYRDLKPKLSKVQYGNNQVIREKFNVRVPTPDIGTCPTSPNCPVKLHVEVVRPKPVKPYATILEVSPYHGTIADRSGSRIFPGPKADPLPEWVDNDEKGGVAEDKTLGLAGYFAPRGYAVVFVDLRGTGQSGGCLDHLGLNDQADAKKVLNWIANQPWSNGRIGMTGHSYVGSTPQMYASTQETMMKAKPLKTIVPSAGLAAMYHHKWQHGVPYFLQWAGPGEAYIQLAYQRSMPGFLGDGFGDSETPQEDTDQFLACQAENSAVMSLEDYESGRYDNRDESMSGPNGFIAAPWDSERDFRRGVTKADIPIFAVHGVNDNAARIPALDWFHERYFKRGDKAWIGQWDHGSNYYPNDRTCQQHDVAPPHNCPNDQWTLALHAWFDKHLKQKRISTGPATEIFLSDRRSVWQAAEWPPRRKNRGTGFYLHPTTNENGTMKLLRRPMDKGDYGVASFVGSAEAFANEPSDATEVNGPEDGALGWDSPPMKEDILLAGIPKLRLNLSMLTDATAPHIHATLYDIPPNGESPVCVVATAIGSRCGISKATFAMNPELAQGPKYVRGWYKPTQQKPVISGPPCPTAGTPCPHRIRVHTRGMAQAHLLKKNHRLRLVITTSHPDKAPFPERTDGTVSVYMSKTLFSKIGVPIVRDIRVRKDPFYANGGGDGGSFPP